MQGYRVQVLAFLGILAICSVLFVKGYKSSVKHPEEKQAKAAPAQMNEAKLEEVVLKAQTPELRERIGKLHTEAEKGKDPAEAYKILAELYDSLGAYPVSGSYFLKLAVSQPGTQNWMRTAEAWMQAARTAGVADTALVQYSIEHAADAYRKVIELDASNLDAKNGLALCLAQSGRDVMQAVQLLRQVLDKDSDNVQATFTLGMLSVQSGQLEKAVVRFEKLLTLEPFNTDNYFYLADVYNRMGKKDKAVETLKACRSVTKDEKGKKNIDELIKEIIKN